MREIKFRGKSIETGKWIYGNFITDRERCWISEFPLFGYHTLYDMSLYATQVEPETVGQYTGIKDKNSVEIYERDIIDRSFINPLTSELTDMKYRIEFEKGIFWAKPVFEGMGTTLLLYWALKKSEVMGNIHDNPELLEQTND